MRCPFFTRFLLLFLSLSYAARADETAPMLLDHVPEEDAALEVTDLVASLDEPDRRAFQGAYVAIDPSRTDLVAMPACDDDGDYVVVLSRGLLELVEHVAYADASDRLRGTSLLATYGELLTRTPPGEGGARPLPLPPSSAPQDPAVRDVAHAFAVDALAWLVADELAHAVAGSFTCPAPTVTHEAGDEEWTADEGAFARRLAPFRMRDVPAADAWATRQLLSHGRSEVPAVELLRVLGRSESLRPEPSTYLTLHPHSVARADAVHTVALAWREADARPKKPTASESPRSRSRSREH